MLGSAIQNKADNRSRAQFLGDSFKLETLSHGEYDKEPSPYDHQDHNKHHPFSRCG